MDDPELILITGANSEIAMATEIRLTKLGYKVYLASRKLGNYTIKNGLHDSISIKPNYVVHFAHDRNNKNDYFNAEGAERLFQQLDGPDLKRFILISSDSSNCKSLSNYGKQKYYAEQAVLKYKKSLVLRVGILGGENPLGPYSKIKNLAKRRKFLAIPGVNYRIFHLSNMEEFLTSLELVLEKNKVHSGLYSTSKQVNLVSLRECLESELDSLPYIIDVNPRMLVTFMQLFAKFNKKIDRIQDSLKVFSVIPEFVSSIHSNQSLE
jgi:dTDP-4-dehydrorhamnose reductase